MLACVIMMYTHGTSRSLSSLGTQAAPGQPDIILGFSLS